jgi:hypothetical protein
MKTQRTLEVSNDGFNWLVLQELDYSKAAFYPYMRERYIRNIKTPTSEQEDLAQWLSAHTPVNRGEMKIDWLCLAKALIKKGFKLKGEENDTYSFKKFR